MMKLRMISRTGRRQVGGLVYYLLINLKSRRFGNYSNVEDVEDSFEISNFGC